MRFAPGHVPALGIGNPKDVTQRGAQELVLRLRHAADEARLRGEGFEVHPEDMERFTDQLAALCAFVRGD